MSELEAKEQLEDLLSSVMAVQEERWERLPVDFLLAMAGREEMEEQEERPQEDKRRVSLLAERRLVLHYRVVRVPALHLVSQVQGLASLLVCQWQLAPSPTESSVLQCQVNPVPGPVWTKESKAVMRHL
jgi:hypothetical protein